MTPPNDPASLTDGQLLDLLDETAADDLSPADLAAIAARMQTSTAVRRAVAARTRLEAVLHGALGEPDLSVQRIVARASRGDRSGLWGRVGFGVLAMLLAGGLGWWLVRNQPAIHRRPLVAANRGEPRATEPLPPAVVPVEAPRPPAQLNPAPNPPAVAGPMVAAEPPQPDAPAPTPAPPQAAPVEQFPWTAALADDAPVQPFASGAFAGFGETLAGYEPDDAFPPATLKQWLVPVEGRPFNIFDGEVRGRHYGGLDGTARLAATWRPDAVLRLAAWEISRFGVTFWSGDVGVNVRFYKDTRPQLVAAYAVNRDGSIPPQNQSVGQLTRLLATDGGAWDRATNGAVEFRQQDGLLVVTRGAVLLVAVPLPQPPTQIVIDGRARFRQLALYRGEPVPLPAAPPRRDLLAGPVQALNWLTSTEPPPVLVKTDGLVTLSAVEPAPSGPKRMAWAAVPLPVDQPGGLCEAVFHLGALTTGSGVYLGDREGRPLHALFISENQQVTEWKPPGLPVLHYGWSGGEGKIPGDPRWRRDAEIRNEVVPLVGPGSWVRVIVGPGGLKLDVSSDGLHWGPAVRSPERRVAGVFGSIGIFAVAEDKNATERRAAAGEPPRSIAVTAVQVRELWAVVAAADPELRAKVPDWGEKPPKNPTEWLAWATAAKPADVPMDDWLRAAAVVTVGRGASEQVCTVALRGLTRHAVAGGVQLPAALALLDDAALLGDYWDHQSRGFAEHYDELTRRTAVQTSAAATLAAELVQIERAYLSAPLWTETQMWAVARSLPDDLAAAAAWAGGTSADDDARRAVIAAAAAELACYLTPAQPEGGWTHQDDRQAAKLMAWASAMARRGPEALRRIVQASWRHPLTTEPSREAAAIAAELTAALAAGAFDDAARLLSTAADLPGLLPAIGESDRFVSPAVFVAQAAAAQPALITTLADQFGPAGLLGVRRSAAAGDVAAVEAATVRFYGTQAAAAAHRWLGDTALTAGDFAGALAHFDAAQRGASDVQRSGLTARRQLAAALAGKALADATPLPGTVTLGAVAIDPPAFAALIGDLQSARSQSAATAVTNAVPGVPVGGLKLEERQRFDGSVGHNAGRGEFDQVDWAGRQIGLLQAGSLLYVSNRYQVLCYDLEARTRRWASDIGGEQGEAHGWPGAAFVPLVEGSRLFARRLTARGPELVCIDTADGKIIWRTQAVTLASDPVLQAGTLVAVTLAAPGGSVRSLELSQFDRDTGQLRSSTPLLTYFDGPDAPAATLTAIAETSGAAGWIVTAPGAIAAVAPDGRVSWVRRLPYLPIAADPSAYRLPVAPPVIAGSRIFYAPGGGRGAVALDVASGNLLWSRPLGDLRGLSGMSGGLLIARTGERVIGLDPATGHSVWNFQSEHLCEGAICRDDALLVTASGVQPNKKHGLSVFWLDPATGLPRSSREALMNRDKPLLCGPLFSYSDRLWGFVGDGPRDARRPLFEFVPDDATPPAVPQPGDAWLTHRRRIKPERRIVVAKTKRAISAAPTAHIASATAVR